MPTAGLLSSPLTNSSSSSPSQPQFSLINFFLEKSEPPMGWTSNHPSSSGAGGSRLRRTKRRLSFIFCGAFRSKSTLQEVGDDPEITSISYAKSSSPVDTHSSTLEVGGTVSIYENGDSSERTSVIEEAFLESGSLNTHSALEEQPSQELVAITEDAAPVYPIHDQSNDIVELVGYDSSDSRSLSIVSDSLPRFQYPGDDVTTTSSSGFLVSDSDQDSSNDGDLLRLDLVSISSNSSPGAVNSRETRRNSMRLFWDALARRSLRRNFDSPTLVFATGIPDDLSSHDRWLLDFSGDLHYYGAGRDLDSFSHHRHERRWLLRSEASETISSIEGGDQETALCASGLHLDGSCSCDSFFTAEESSSLASISRIILLAEALFEVLDEIHHQSMSLSLSPLSLPAPESVVDAFPLKYYKKNKNVESDSTDVRQCYICLADYEEGDKLRVLPCNHDFHIPCIDKWLKEVNRVCPVCRHDVCEGRGECSVSN